MRTASSSMSNTWPMIGSGSVGRKAREGMVIVGAAAEPVQPEGAKRSYARNSTRTAGGIQRGGARSGGLAFGAVAAVACAERRGAAHDVFSGSHARGVRRRVLARDFGHCSRRRRCELFPAARSGLYADYDSE